jgi:hypothetical protein
MAGLIAVKIAIRLSAVTVTATGAAIRLARVNASFYRVAGIDSAGIVVVTGFLCVCALTICALIYGACIVVVAITVAGAAIWLWRVYASFYRITGIDSTGIVVITSFLCVRALTIYALIYGTYIVVVAITVAGTAIRLWCIYALIVDARINGAYIVVFAIVVSQTSTNQPCRVTVSNSRTVCTCCSCSVHNLTRFTTLFSRLESRHFLRR